MHWMLGYKFSKTKTAPTLGVWGGGGGRHGWEEGGWKARCLEEGFHQEITYSKAAVSTSPYHITHQYILVFYHSYFFLPHGKFSKRADDRKAAFNQTLRAVK